MTSIDSTTLLPTLRDTVLSGASTLSDTIHDAWLADPENVLFAGCVLALTAAATSWALNSQWDASALEAHTVAEGSHAIMSKYHSHIFDLEPSPKSALESKIKHWVKEAHQTALRSEEYHTAFAAEMGNVGMMTLAECGKASPGEYADFLVKHKTATSLARGSAPSCMPTACALGVLSAMK